MISRNDPGLKALPGGDAPSEPPARVCITPGTTLAAADALHGDQQTFTRAQVAYLMALAYETGRRHTLAENLAETIACWDEHATPKQTREQRIAARLADMERRHGPVRYHGGPVDWETGKPLNGGMAVAA